MAVPQPIGHPQLMSRRLRPHAPGATFHITARTVGREHWFDEAVRRRVVGIIAESLLRSDALLCAFTVMSNHLHLVVRQGLAPLEQLLQPMLTRTALLLQRKLGRKGHIFEQPYRDVVCSNPDHLRMVIAYTHLNPCRAGICNDVSDYEWTSHRAYIGAPTSKTIPQLLVALPLFASEKGQTIEELRSDYLEFVECCLRRDRARAESPDERHNIKLPRSDEGDAYWSRHLSKSVLSEAPPDAAARLDLRDISRNVIAELCPGLSLDALRVLRGGPDFVRVRHEIIIRATLAGYSGVKIARSLNISAATVSRVATFAFTRVEPDGSPSPLLHAWMSRNGRSKGRSALPHRD
jgi:putative transposase